jgi:hypothetical protein
MWVQFLLIGAHVADFGAVCDCVTDDYAAIQSALESRDPLIDFRGMHCCKSSQTLHLDRPGVKIIGDGRYVFSHGLFAGTYIRFAPTVAGLQIGAGATDSVIESIALIGTRSYVDPPCTDEPTGILGVTAYGVRLHARVVFRNVGIDSFDGDGLIADCGAIDHIGRVGNCNGTRLDDLWVSENAGHGIWMSGGDANAWRVDRVVANSNRCEAVYSRAFLGSDWSHINVQRADGSGTRGVKMRNTNARNAVGWTYLEGPAVMDLEAPSVRISGFGASEGPSIEGSVFRGKWGIKNALPRDDPSKHVHVNLGETCGERCAFEFETAGRSKPLSLAHDGEWYWWRVGQTIKVMGFGDLGVDARHWGTVAFAYPIAMGIPPNDRTIFWSDGIPRDTCRGGDVRFNSAIGPRDRCSIFVCDSGSWACGSRVSP